MFLFAVSGQLCKNSKTPLPICCRNNKFLRGEGINCVNFDPMQFQFGLFINLSIWHVTIFTFLLKFNC